jgi:hypothetical protein
VIEAAFDSDVGPLVVGGAVAYWTSIAGADGTFNVWTKASGSKRALSTTSPVGIFAANDDGSRVAFLTAVVNDLANLAIVDTTASAPVVTPLLADADRVNLTAFECPPVLAFSGTNLLTTFCVGESLTTTDARAYWVAGGTNLVRLDDLGTGTAAGPLTPSYFTTDRLASKVYVVSNTPEKTGRLLTTGASVAAASSVVVEDGAELAGFLTDDGQSLVYRTTNGGIRRTATTGTPAPKTLVAGAKGFLGVTQDLSRMIYRTAGLDSPLLDIRSADTSTENQAGVALVPTPSALPYGFTGAGAHVIYLVNGGTGVQLTSQAALGGEPLPLAINPAGILLPSSGNGLVLRIPPLYEEQGLRFSGLRYMDATSGDTSPILETAVPEGGIFLWKDKVVYTRLAQQGAGLYTFTVPPK